jgi:hypothetical protein
VEVRIQAVFAPLSASSAEAMAGRQASAKKPKSLFIGIPVSSLLSVLLNPGAGPSTSPSVAHQIDNQGTKINPYISAGYKRAHRYDALICPILCTDKFLFSRHQQGFISGFKQKIRFCTSMAQKYMASTKIDH